MNLLARREVRHGTCAAELPCTCSVETMMASEEHSVTVHSSTQGRPCDASVSLQLQGGYAVVMAAALQKITQRVSQEMWSSSTILYNKMQS